MNPERETFLKKLKQKSEAQNVPNVTEKNGRFLHMLVQIKKPKNILEIGTANGYSTIFLADSVEKHGGKVTTIDHSKPSYEWACENFRTTGLDTIINPIFGKAEDILPTLKEKYDMVFLDAQKAQYGVFWNLIKSLLSDDPLVIVDDVLKFPEKTDHFHEIIAQEKDFTSLILPIDGDDGVMVIVRR